MKAKKISLVIFLIAIMMPMHLFGIPIKIKLDGTTKAKIEEINATIRQLQDKMSELPEDSKMVLEGAIQQLQTTLSSLVANFGQTGVKLIDEAGREINETTAKFFDEAEGIWKEIHYDIEGTTAKIFDEAKGVWKQVHYDIEGTTTKIFDEAEGVWKVIHDDFDKTAKNILDQTQTILTKMNRDVDEILKGNIQELTSSLDKLAKSTTGNMEESLIRVITHADERTQDLILKTLHETDMLLEKRMELAEAIVSRQGEKFVSLLEGYTNNSAQMIDKILEDRTAQVTASTLQLINETDSVFIRQLNEFDKLLESRMKQMERMGIVFVDALSKTIHEELNFVKDSVMTDFFDELDSFRVKTEKSLLNIIINFFEQLNVSSTLFVNVIVKGVAATLILLMIFGITLRAVKYEKSIKRMQVPFLIVFFISMTLFIYVSYPIQGSYVENNSQKVVAIVETHYEEVLGELQSKQIDSELRDKTLETINLLRAYERSIVPTTHKAIQKQHEIRKKANKLTNILY